MARAYGRPDHVVVVGAGAVGLMTAYHLRREGVAVTLIDARQSGRGAAEINAGWVVPAESAPVPGPGMIAQSLKWMLRKDSPLYIRPSLDPVFVKFMLGMWRACNAEDQRAGFQAHFRLVDSAVDSYASYRADGMDFELHDAGLLMAFTERHNLDHHRGMLDLARQFGRDPQILLDDAVRVQEPALSDAVIGGIYFPHEQHLDPGALMRALHRRLVELGVEIRENAPLEGFRQQDDRIVEITAGAERLWPDAVVLAAGPWSGPLSRLLGEPLPVRPGKGYSIDTPAFGLRSAINLSDAKVAITPLDRALRLAGTMEFGGLDEELNQVRISAILAAPQRYLRDWTPPTGPVTPRAGIRPMTPDGLPIIGRLGSYANAFVSTGHGMQGITLGPGSAEALTTLVTTGEPPEVLTPFSPLRFTKRPLVPLSRKEILKEVA